MHKSSIKYLQIEFKNIISKNHTTKSNWFHPRDAGMVNIHKSNINTVHQQEENKNNMIILIVREKAFGKLQHPFMTKALKKLGNKRICLNIIMLRLNMSSL
jgi:hypothetical protein